MEFLTRTHLRAWNTVYRRRPIWTYRSANGHTFNQIDYICGSPSLPVRNCGVLPSFPFDSDHRLIRMTLSTRRRAPHRPPRVPRPILNRAIYRNDVETLSAAPLPIPVNSEDTYHAIRAVRHFVTFAFVTFFPTRSFRVQSSRNLGSKFSTLLRTNLVRMACSASIL